MEKLQRGVGNRNFSLCLSFHPRPNISDRFPTQGGGQSAPPLPPGKNKVNSILVSFQHIGILTSLPWLFLGNPQSERCWWGNFIDEMVLKRKMVNCIYVTGAQLSTFSGWSIVSPQTWHPSISPLYDILDHTNQIFSTNSPTTSPSLPKYSFG